jgi:predicted nucleotidyltransferase
MDPVDLILEKRDAIKEICAKHGATAVRIFGSCARDDYRPDSDVDMLVDFTLPWDFGTLCDLQDELEQLLGRKVDLGTESMLRPRVRATVLAEAVTL